MARPCFVDLREVATVRVESRETVREVAEMLSIADYLSRLDFVLLDELGYLPFAQAGGQLLFNLVSKLYERTSIIVTTNLMVTRVKVLSGATRTGLLVDLKAIGIPTIEPGVRTTLAG